MNFESIKAGFLSYLSEKQENSGGEDAVSYIPSSVSIFMYSNEFKDYLVSEAGADASIFSKSINEIMQMDIVNGKLVDDTQESNSDSFAADSSDNSNFMTEALNEALSNESVISALDSDNSGELNEDEISEFLNGLTANESGEISFDSLAEAVTEIQGGSYNVSSTETSGEINADESIAAQAETSDETETYETTDDEGMTGLTDLLNKVYDNKTAIKTLDIDGDGALSDEEKAKFEEFIKGYDGDDSSLSEDDVKQAMSEIIDGTFSYETEDISIDETPVEVEDIEDTTISTDKAAEVTTPQASSSSTGSTGTGYVSSGASSSSTSAATDDSLENKSLSELETIKTEREQDVSDAQEKVNAVYSGENAAVNQAQKNYENAKEAYDEAVENDENISDDLKERRETNLENIENQESNIDNLNININDKEEEISEQKNTISGEESTLSGYKTSLSKLQSQTSDDEDKQAEINQAVSDVKAAIEELENQIEEDKKDLETLEDEKSKLNDELEEAKEQLSDFETERAQIEDEILENCSDNTKKALEAFNEAKDNVSSVKESELASAKADLSEAQAALDEVNDVINTKKEKEAEKEYSVSSGTLPDDLFQGALKGQEDLVAEIADEYDIEPEFLASIICLETGYGTSNLAVNYNNFGGVTGSGDAGSVNGFASYSSMEEGLRAMAKNLSKYSSRYSDVSSVDIDNVQAIGNHYCVGGDWANKVTSIYNKIKNMEN